jgi:FO synthase subunit 1
MTTTTDQDVRNELTSDILVLGEDAQDVITYSYTAPFTLSRMCRNHCPYCSFRKQDGLAVPYSTIRQAKKCRTLGAREALYVVGERPDKFPHIRSILDLWGFSSYLDYVYTVCELGFLEGLVPTLEAGFLSPTEMSRLSEVCAMFRIMLDAVDDTTFNTLYAKSPGKKLELRLKLLEWAGRLKIPTETGIIVGVGGSKTHFKHVFQEISKIHEAYGTIHTVHLQNFTPEPHTPMAKKSPPSKKEMLDMFELAKSILPSDISLTIPVELNPNLEDFIHAGLRDLGRIYEGKQPHYKVASLEIADLETRLAAIGFHLQQRFPLKKSFIKNGLYSKKLGQAFDSYRYKIKKDGQESKTK